MLNYQVNINEQFKSTEILFNGKPSEAVREKLKAEPDNMYLGVKYYRSPEDSKVKDLRYFDWWNYENLNSESKAKLIKLSPDDVHKLIEAYEIERKNFEKRLNAYLKRYGTSKLNVWTYLVD